MGGITISGLDSVEYVPDWNLLPRLEYGFGCNGAFAAAAVTQRVSTSAMRSLVNELSLAELVRDTFCALSHSVSRIDRATSLKAAERHVNARGNLEYFVGVPGIDIPFFQLINTVVELAVIAVRRLRLDFVMSGISYPSRSWRG